MADEKLNMIRENAYNCLSIRSESVRELLAYIDKLRAQLDAATKPLTEVPNDVWDAFRTIGLLKTLNVLLASRREAAAEPKPEPVASGPAADPLVNKWNDKEWRRWAEAHSPEEYRIAELTVYLETEKAMHAGWRKRAEDAEAKLESVVSGPVVATDELANVFLSGWNHYATGVYDGLNAVFAHLHKTGQLSQAADHLPDAGKKDEQDEDSMVKFKHIRERDISWSKDVQSGKVQWSFEKASDFHNEYIRWRESVTVSNDMVEALMFIKAIEQFPPEVQADVRKQIAAGKTVPLESVIDPLRFQEAERIFKRILADSGYSGEAQDISGAMLSMIEELRKDG